MRGTAYGESHLRWKLRRHPEQLNFARMRRQHNNRKRRGLRSILNLANRHHCFGLHYLNYTFGIGVNATTTSTFLNNSLYNNTYGMYLENGSDSDSLSSNFVFNNSAAGISITTQQAPRSQATSSTRIWAWPFLDGADLTEDSGSRFFSNAIADIRFSTREARHVCWLKRHCFRQPFRKLHQLYALLVSDSIVYGAGYDLSWTGTSPELHRTCSPSRENSLTYAHRTGRVY